MLLVTLEALETELHHAGIRCSKDRLEQLLHPDFYEVGRSGRPYDRATCIRFLLAESAPLNAESRGFQLTQLSDTLALLNYKSAHRLDDGSLVHHALRSSVWQLTGAHWQLRYHQGTPAFELWS
jgi:hypothetical protein